MWLPWIKGLTSSFTKKVMTLLCNMLAIRKGGEFPHLCLFLANIQKDHKLSGQYEILFIERMLCLFSPIELRYFIEEILNYLNSDA